MNKMPTLKPINPARSLGAFQRYPKNCWYVAAGRIEVDRKPLGRKLLDEHVVLFRKVNGEPVAMVDHCPHRGFRFSNSRLLGDTIQCGYHGMIFNEQGRCIKMTGSGAVPQVMRVRTFPLVEKRLYIWIWMGDPEMADPSLIPKTPYEDNEEFDHQFYYPLPFAGNFQLAQDNLLDATHVSFLHAGLLDNEDRVEFTSADIDSHVHGNAITRVITMRNFVPNESVEEIWHVPAGRPLTRKITVVNHLPCAVNIQNQFFDMENGGALISERVTAIGLVPADRNHAYHFTAVSSSFRQTNRDKEAQLRVLQQDIFAIEQIQLHFEESPDTAVETTVASDRLGIMSRRLIDDMVRREESSASPAG
jgi:phenylpropionate dioxygenase-like ring-hydroxylating dioxygenase large terminal subunit